MKCITFPSEEIQELKKLKIIVTTRVDAEFNKYSLDDILTTPWGDNFIVTSVKTINNVKKHPHYSSLTQKQVKLLSQYKEMNVIKMKKVSNE